jgi:hypothetical protein
MMSWSRTWISPDAVKWSEYDSSGFNVCNVLSNGKLIFVKMHLCEEEVIFVNPDTKKEVLVDFIMNVNKRFKPLNYKDMDDGY